MANKVQVANSVAAKDKNAASFVARFSSGEDDGYVLSPTARFATHVIINAGEQPSYAFAGVPIDTLWDEAAPALALKKTGFAGRVPLRSRACVDYIQDGKSICVLAGTLVSYQHVIHEDSILALIFDDRWLLSKITVFGRMVYDPVREIHYFDASKECVFNEKGFPNCIDSPYGPRFAPSHRFGYASTVLQEDVSEPAPGSATNRARSFTVADMFQYLRDMHYTSEGDKRALMKVDYGTQTVPKHLNWPSSLGSIVGNTRVGRNFDVQNQSLLRALSLIAAKAGAYQLITTPAGSSFSSTLGIADMNPPPSTGSALMLQDYRPSLDVGELMNDPTVVMAGTVGESVINYFDDVCIVGDPPAVERWLSTSNSGLTLASAEGDGGIEPAWDRGGAAIGSDPVAGSDEALFKLMITNHAVPNSAEAFKAAREAHPLVFVAYRIKPGFNIWKNTKWALQNSNYPAILPHQLTSDQQGGVTNPRDLLFKPILIEWEASSQGSGAWTVAGRYQDLAVHADGQFIMVPMMADAAPPQTWYNTQTPFATAYQSYNGATMKPLNIRLNLAAQADWALTGRASGDPNQSGGRVAGSKSTFLTVADPLDYVEHLRQGSKPLGLEKMTPAIGNFPDKSSAGNELFTDRVDATNGRLPNHATVRLKDVRRVEYTGEVVLPKINPGLMPGRALSIETANGIPTFSVARTITHDAAAQTTTVELAAADRRGIFDIPSAPSSYSSGGSGGSPVEKGGDSAYTPSTGGKSPTPPASYNDYGGGSSGARGSSGSTGSPNETGKINGEGSYRADGSINPGNQSPGGRAADAPRSEATKKLLEPVAASRAEAKKKTIKTESEMGGEVDPNKYAPKDKAVDPNKYAPGALKEAKKQKEQDQKSAAMMDSFTDDNLSERAAKIVADRKAKKEAELKSRPQSE